MPSTPTKNSKRGSKRSTWIALISSGLSVSSRQEKGFQRLCSETVLVLLFGFLCFIQCKSCLGDWVAPKNQVPYGARGGRDLRHCS